MQIMHKSQNNLDKEQRIYIIWFQDVLYFQESTLVSFTLAQHLAQWCRTYNAEINSYYEVQWFSTKALKQCNEESKLFSINNVGKKWISRREK